MLQRRNHNYAAMQHFVRLAQQSASPGQPQDLASGIGAGLAGARRRREVGMGAAFCRASSHLGALAPQLLEAANAGFVAKIPTNTSPMLALPATYR